MLGAFLWNFHTTVASVYYLLTHSLYFITQDNRHWSFIVSNKICQTNTVVHLLYRTHKITRSLQLLNGGKGTWKIFPSNRLLSTQSCLVNFRLGRLWRDAAQTDALNEECIGSSEHRPNIHLTAHVIQHNCHR